MVDGVCEQRAQSVIATSRNPALTLAYNWFNRSYNRNPFLYGPETWAHVFNNYCSDVDYAGLAVACNASVLMQGNAFESTNSALSINDNGSGTYSYCTANPWGKAYAPMNTGTDEDNLFDSSSTLTLHSQPTDGTGLTKPTRISGHRFTLTVPTDSGASTETYEVTLNADPTTVAAQVKATAGAGTLF
jgi:pectate lyase